MFGISTGAAIGMLGAALAVCLLKANQLFR